MVRCGCWAGLVCRSSLAVAHYSSIDLSELCPTEACYSVAANASVESGVKLFSVSHSVATIKSTVSLGHGMLTLHGAPVSSCIQLGLSAAASQCDVQELVPNHTEPQTSTEQLQLHRRWLLQF